MKQVIVLFIFVVVAGLGLTHCHLSDRGRLTTAPVYSGLERQFDGTALVSGHEPAVRLQFSPEFEYLGGQQFVLYGVADAEQHFFVEKAADGNLKSVYWIQFEAYLDDNDYHYDYEDADGRMPLGGIDFYLDTAFVDADPARRRRGSDGALARQFLAREGLSFPDHYAYARLVHLTDETRRKELMIIFIEDLAPQGLTAAMLQAGGERAGEREAVQAKFHQRIRQTLMVQPYERAN